MRVSVIGGDTSCTDEEYERAREVGELLGRRGHTVVCGGEGGVMEGACEGAKRTDGESIGILPGERRDQANDYVDTAIATGMDHARNTLVVMNGDAVIAVGGGGGTLAELGFAHVFERPIAGLETHRINDLDRIRAVDSPKEAVDYVESEV